MQFIFFQEGVTASLIPIYTLIEHQPENIVGCILLTDSPPGKMPPAWFTQFRFEENPAFELLQQVNQGKSCGLHVFLIVKEPNTLLQLTVLACINCCNFNSSGEGGRGGKKLLELLAKHNIPTYPAEVITPNLPNRIIGPSNKDELKYRQAMQDTFFEAFNIVASDWLPNTWGLEPVSH
ncbi:hypothetical protein [Laspinema olomoucense]|uniref:hypothetical protein n=1 Tax=Laspinema olomoucense TaxID=3231600 RepID=UPI0021BBB40B|nr:hypothetical protein [Laspinema sp. D3d]MCT7971119.1 hypothetical protein [Laspinema sp. D3d]